MSALDTGTETVLADLDEGVLTITMNRPERRNALSGDMLAGLAAMLERGENDSAVGCVVLTGAGGAFSAGGDVKGMAEAGGVVASAGGGGGMVGTVNRQRTSQKATSGRLYRMPKPTIASLPGAAAGAGLGLALACDLRIAASNSVMLTAFANVALASDYGTGWFLTRLVGSTKAREMMYLSERVGTDEMVRLGLVNRVVAPEELVAATIDVARRLANGPRMTLSFMKENLNRAVHASLEDYMDTEVFLHNYSGTTADHREASQAFVEKRAPKFGS